MDYKIRQISTDEVIQAIVDNEKVLRINYDNMKVCDLASKSVSTIRNDFEKDGYIYVIVEGEND